MSEKLNEAIAFAVQMHSGQRRKMENIPFILHPMEVAAIAGGLTTDEDVIIAALLHDTVEDTQATSEEIQNKFGERIARYVSSETEDKRQDRPPEDTWKIRKEETLKELFETEDINVKILWLSDKLSNMRALLRSYIKMGDKAFEFFHQKDKSQQAWYYKSVAEGVKVLDNTPAYKEYTDIVNKIFN